MDFKNILLFDGKTYEDLIKEIYFNSVKKDLEITGLLTKLNSMIKDPNTAAVLLPMLAEYTDVGVKNNDQLVKLATLLQKFFLKSQASETETGDILSDAERDELIKSLKEISTSKLTEIPVKVVLPLSEDQ